MVRMLHDINNRELILYAIRLDGFYNAESETWVDREGQTIVFPGPPHTPSTTGKNKEALAKCVQR